MKDTRDRIGHQEHCALMTRTPLLGARAQALYWLLLCLFDTVITGHLN